MRLFGLLGKTLKHSFSKSYFTKKFAGENITDCRYENFELANISQLSHLIQSHPELAGLNVTIPYKEEVLSFLHVQNDIVQEIKACNCIKFVNGQLHGYNTDVTGFQQSLQKYLGPQHTNALILGTGGAAKAVQYALKGLGIHYQMVSRSKSAATITYNELDEKWLKEYPLIINTSPIGMYPHIDDAPPIPYSFITPQHLLFDLIYNPSKTVFLQKGEERGATICNGEEMLILQAEEGWRIWNS